MGFGFPRPAIGGAFRSRRPRRPSDVASNRAPFQARVPENAAIARDRRGFTPIRLLRAESEAGISPAAAQAFFDISQILGFNAAGVGLAILVGATAIASLRGSQLVPRPLVVPLLVLALTLLTPLARVTLMVAFLLLPLYSVRLYRMAGG